MPIAPSSKIVRLKSALIIVTTLAFIRKEFATSLGEMRLIAVAQ